MSKKKDKLNLKIFLVATAILILLGLLTFTYNKPSFKPVKSQVKNSTLTPTPEAPKVYRNKVNEANINDYVDFTIPSGWKVDTLKKQSPALKDSLYQLFSPEASWEGGPAPDNGVALIISSFNAPSYNNLDEYMSELQDFPQYAIKESITVDGYPAYTWTDNAFESYRQNYVIMKDKTFWRILLLSENEQVGQKYLNELNSFISSIKFK